MPVSDHQSPAVHLRGVVKRYDQITAVDGLDLDVPSGTCVAATMNPIADVGHFAFLLGFAVLTWRLAIWRMTIRLID
jgi:hypothetical protein